MPRLPARQCIRECFALSSEDRQRFFRQHGSTIRFVDNHLRVAAHSGAALPRNAASHGSRRPCCLGVATPLASTGLHDGARMGSSGIGSAVAVSETGAGTADGGQARRFDALLLDFGSVVTFTAFERHRDSERALGLAHGTFGWLGPVDPATDPLWRSMERGEISERDYWSHRAAEVGSLVGQPGWTPLDFFQAIRGDDPNLAVRQSARRTVAAARAAGLRVGILSNEL